MPVLHLYQYAGFGDGSGTGEGNRGDGARPTESARELSGGGTATAGGVGYSVLYWAVRYSLCVRVDDWGVGKVD